MKKEVLLAIIIGFGIGLLATFGVYNAQKSLKEANQIFSPVASNEEKKETQINEQILSLAIPLDQSISKENKTLLSGTTTPNSWVVILTENEEILTQADKKGNFETEISLIGGENEIEVQAINETGERATKVITVVYSTAEI